MCNTKRTVLIAMVICVGLAGVCSASSDAERQSRLRKKLKAANKKFPTVTELLDKYAETQDKLQSFIIKSETSCGGASTSLSGRLPRIPEGSTGSVSELRFDGKRYYWHNHMWGHVGKSPVFVPKDEAHYNINLWNGETFFQYGGQEKHQVLPNGSLKIKSYTDNREKWQKIFIAHTYTPLRGYCYEDKERIDIILRQADSLSVRNRTEKIGGYDCYVINAKGKHGAYKVWIDPEHGYNIAKLMLRRTTGDLRLGKPMGGKAKLLFSLNNIRFEKIDNIWIPIEADRKTNQTYVSGDFSKSSGHIKRTEVILNPDHDALGSFVLNDIQNGTRVSFINGVSLKNHTWQDGAVVDADGKKVDLKKIVSKTKNIGK